MVSSTLVKISSPVAKSCLYAISAALLIDAILTIFAAAKYPYLIDTISDVHMPNSRSITYSYSAIAVVAIFVAISTAVASYRSGTNYVLVHACITGVFLPVSILVYFTTISARYHPSEYEADYYQMIANYRINEGHQNRTVSNSGLKFSLTSFINIIDTLQSRYTCCGVDSSQDWESKWDYYIAPSCCTETYLTKNASWANQFHVSPEYEFKHCKASNSHHVGCLAALKEDERSKHAWLSDLIVFSIVMTLANTIGTLLLFGLSKTEDIPRESNRTELSIVGVSSKPRPSQPTITGIRHRPSVFTLGPINEAASSIPPTVRFNLNRSPRVSTSGPSRFSPAARRGSSFI